MIPWDNFTVFTELYSLLSLCFQVLLRIPELAQSHLLSTHQYIDIDIASTTADSSSNDVLASLTDEEITARINNDERIAQLSNYIVTENSGFLLDEKAMRHYAGLDIREHNSRNSCCFTKRLVKIGYAYSAVSLAHSVVCNILYYHMHISYHNTIYNLNK